MLGKHQRYYSGSGLSLSLSCWSIAFAVYIDTPFVSSRRSMSSLSRLQARSRTVPLVLDRSRVEARRLREERNQFVPFFVKMSQLFVVRSIYRVLGLTCHPIHTFDITMTVLVAGSVAAFAPSMGPPPFGISRRISIPSFSFLHRPWHHLP